MIQNASEMGPTMTVILDTFKSVQYLAKQDQKLIKKFSQLQKRQQQRQPQQQHQQQRQPN